MYFTKLFANLRSAFSYFEWIHTEPGSQADDNHFARVTAHSAAWVHARLPMLRGSEHGPSLAAANAPSEHHPCTVVTLSENVHKMPPQFPRWR